MLPLPSDRILSSNWQVEESLLTNSNENYYYSINVIKYSLIFWCQILILDQQNFICLLMMTFSCNIKAKSLNNSLCLSSKFRSIKQVFSFIIWSQSSGKVTIKQYFDTYHGTNKILTNHHIQSFKMTYMKFKNTITLFRQIFCNLKIVENIEEKWKIFASI